MKTSAVLYTPSGSSPFVRGQGTGYLGRTLIKRFAHKMQAALGEGASGRLVARPYVSVATQSANACITAASVAAADTITINGTVLTAAEHRANCTVTCGTSIDDGDTVTVNGAVFTAKSAVTDATTQFLITGTAATDAAALVAVINASVDPLVYGLIEAVRRAADGVVDIYAIAANSTVGNSYTIATSDAVDLAITNDNSGSFAGGLAAVNNEFDPIGSNARVAAEVARCINASTTSLVSGHVSAAAKTGTITCSNVVTGDYVLIDGVKLLARTGTVAVVTGLLTGEFSCNGTDTQDAASMVIAINNHPTLSQRVFASNSSGVVTVYERGPSTGQGIPLSSSSGSTLAIAGTLNGNLGLNGKCLIDSIIPGIAGNATTLATSGATLAITLDSSGRLAGGASTAYTY